MNIKKLPKCARLSMFILICSISGIKIINIRGVKIIDYSDLGKFTEELMKSYVAGEIDANEFVEFIDTRIEQMKDTKIVMTEEGRKLHEAFLMYLEQTE